MPKLNPAVQVFIVQQLACYEKPAAIVDAVKEEFGVVITRQNVETYDPKKGCRTKRWVDLHAEHRKAFVETMDGLAGQHRSWRIAEIEDIARRAKRSRNYKVALDALDQLRCEVGEITARRGVAVPESAEDYAIKVRSMMDAMDAATIAPPPPPTGPTLVTDKQAAVA